MLIILEGRDGVGKTTLAAKIAKALSDMGTSVACVREPVSRDCLKAAFPIEAFAEDRLKQLRDVVAPAYLNKTVVVSDRSIFSSLAYQNLKGHPDVEGHILQANRHAVKLLRRLAAADALMILFLNPETTLRPPAEGVDENDQDTALSKRLRGRYPAVLRFLPREISRNVLTCSSYDEYDPLAFIVCSRARGFFEQEDAETASFVRDWLDHLDSVG